MRENRATVRHGMIRGAVIILGSAGLLAIPQHLFAQQSLVRAAEAGAAVVARNDEPVSANSTPEPTAVADGTPAPLNVRPPDQAAGAPGPAATAPVDTPPATPHPFAFADYFSRLNGSLWPHPVTLAPAAEPGTGGAVERNDAPVSANSEPVPIAVADGTPAPPDAQPSDQQAAADPAQAAPAANAPPPKPDPFAFADFTWLNGNPRQQKPAFDSPVFTLDLRVDTNAVHTNNNPIDHSITGSAELARENELQLQQLGIGGDFHYDNVRARLMTQFGLFSQLTPRNDGSLGRGQWLNAGDSYKYLAEAYGGYHIDKMDGINVDFGIFMSYVGLFSYYNYDNWAYQPSYVSANTPWFFEGMRIQLFPTDKFKQEIWLINGWQSYGMYFNEPGIGGQTLWRPNGAMSFLSNNYYGKDSAGNPDRRRYHTDNSATLKFYESKDHFVTRDAMSFTFDAGCESGDGVVCTGGQHSTNPLVAATAGPGCLPCSQFFIGWMGYDRVWFDKNLFALTAGGGWINNPGRYLAILPVVNGATAVTGTPYFTENPGDQLRAWDWGVTFDYMPKDDITFRWEVGYRDTNVPYWSGHGGVTPPGGNTGTPAIPVPGWAPDLVKTEYRFLFAMMVKL